MASRKSRMLTWVFARAYFGGEGGLLVNSVPLEDQRDGFITHLLALFLAVEGTIDTKITAESDPGLESGKVYTVLDTEPVGDCWCSDVLPVLLLAILLGLLHGHNIALYRLGVNDDRGFLLDQIVALRFSGAYGEDQRGNGHGAGRSGRRRAVMIRTHTHLARKDDLEHDA